METIGSRIKKSRKDAKLTQGELAALVDGAHAPDISGWENDHVVPSTKTIHKLAAALKVDPGWLITGEVVEKPSLGENTAQPVSSSRTQGDKMTGSGGLSLSPEEAMYRDKYEKAQETIRELQAKIIKLLEDGDKSDSPRKRSSLERG